MVLRLRNLMVIIGLIFIGVTLIGFPADGINTESLQAGDPVIIYQLSGQITGVTTLTIQEFLSTAENANARLAVVELSSTGGELGAVQNIMQLFAASPIPVLIYVPPAAQAISGGTYLVMASHVAGMGVGAQIGGCHPIIGIVPILDPFYLDSLTTLLTTYTHLHERNETTAERFIRENLYLEATGSLSTGAIEFVSNSLPELLSDLESYTLVQREEQPNDITFRILPTADLGSYTYEAIIQDFNGVASAPQMRYFPNAGLTLLAFLAHPVVNFILLQIGIWGFIFALNAPGHAGEIVSLVCIILAMVGMGIIGISLAGVILMFLGVVLIIIEAKTDIGFAGAAGIGGVICFALGGIFFLPPSQWLIPSQLMWLFQGATVAVAIIFAGLFAYAIMKAAEARRLTSDFDSSKILGALGIAETSLDPEGRVRALGETWTAVAENPPIKSGEHIEIIRLDGIRLVVRRVKPPIED